MNDPEFPWMTGTIKIITTRLGSVGEIPVSQIEKRVVTTNDFGKLPAFGGGLCRGI